MLQKKKWVPLTALHSLANVLRGYVSCTYFVVADGRKTVLPGTNCLADELIVNVESHCIDVCFRMTAITSKYDQIQYLYMFIQMQDVWT